MSSEVGGEINLGAGGARIFGIIFAVVGLLFIIMFFKKKKNCTSVTNGTVVDIEVSRDFERNYDRERDINYIEFGNHRHYDLDENRNYSGHTYNGTRPVEFPIYEYTVNGQTYTKKATSSSGNGKYRIGDEVDIYYNPIKPDEFYESGNNAEIILGVFCLIMGVIFIII